MGVSGDDEETDIKLSSNNSGANPNLAGSSRGDKGGSELSVAKALKYLRSPFAEGRFTGSVSQQLTMAFQISSVVIFVVGRFGRSPASVFLITTGSLSPG
jgi:hypothetical protein